MLSTGKSKLVSGIFIMSALLSIFAFFRDEFPIIAEINNIIASSLTNDPPGKGPDTPNPVDPNSVDAVFDLLPQYGESFSYYEIYDSNGNLLIRKPSTDLKVYLPPGHYGYAFVDKEGNHFEKRHSGFTIEAPSSPDS